MHVLAFYTSDFRKETSLTKFEIIYFKSELKFTRLKNSTFHDVH